MEFARHKARFDWLVELAGASALAAAGGFAAWKAAPSLALPGGGVMTAGGVAGFGFGMLAMRSVRPSAPVHALPELAVEPIAAGELLLDQVFEEPLLLDEVYEVDALLLEDRLSEPEPESRVVRLFAGSPQPTPGQLKERIDRHLAGPPRQPPADLPPPPDATAALYAALDDLKRSLR